MSRDTTQIRDYYQGIAPTLTRRASDAIDSISPDCRHYHGDRPCVHNRLCGGCPHYEPYAQRVCVIKFGALGDVIRTLCILPELRRRFPKGHITWVTLDNATRMLRGHPMIDRLITFDSLTGLVLGQESFDTVISLDKEPQPCALVMSLFAKQKLGIGLSDHGTAIPLNPEARDYFHLGLCDELKFQRNSKSYPRLIYEALGWEYQGQRYELPPVDRSIRERIRTTLRVRGWVPDRPTLGINVGAGRAFANKMWPVSRQVDLIRRVLDDLPATQIVLLGGGDERETVRLITTQLRNRVERGEVIDPGTDHDESTFAGLVEACDTLLTGDTMAMHVGIALRKKMVVFFGPTCEQEIDLFGNGEKLTGIVPCSPCYKRECDQNNACVKHHSIDDVVAAIGRVLTRSSENRVSLPVIPLRKAG